MEKMVWERPEMNEVAFAANEYVAACGDSGISGYEFECNADSTRESLYYYRNEKVEEGAQMPSSFSGSATYVGSFTDCGEEHNTGNSTDFYWGFIDYNNNRRHDIPASGDNTTLLETVIVWLELNRWGEITDGHATTQLDMTKWETQKS